MLQILIYMIHILSEKLQIVIQMKFNSVDRKKNLSNFAPKNNNVQRTT